MTKEIEAKSILVKNKKPAGWFGVHYQFNIYRAFTTAEEELYLSYVSTDKEQRAKRQSILISRIKKMFKNLKEESDVVSKNDSILTAESTFNQMLSNIKNFKQGKEIDEAIRKITKKQPFPKMTNFGKRLFL